MQPGERYQLPLGVVVQVRPPTPGLVAVSWLLVGPGGWGLWATTPDGLIMRVEPNSRERSGFRLVGTSWDVADLRELEV